MSGLVSFLGAFLLFFIEPMIGKMLTPRLGGSPAVWAACMVFFQAVLLAGYALAHGLVRWFRPRLQVAAIGLLAAAALLGLGALARLSGAPFQPPGAWLADAARTPIRSVFALLALAAGLPLLLLAATAPLVQAWFARARPGQSPFRLYALSNAGSLAGLLAYPLVAEPLASTERQAWLVGLLFLAQAGALLWIGRQSGKAGASAPPGDPSAEPVPPGPAAPWHHWLLASMGGSMVLVGITNAISARVASTPLLWVPPLVLYLLTFIVAFSERWNLDRPAVLAIAGLACAGGLVFLRRLDNTWHEGAFVVLALAVLAASCLLCHVFLHARRPAPRHLTQYYLVMAAGGALGGTFVGLLAPVLFTRIFETDIAFALVALVGLLWLGSGSWPRRNLLALVPLAILCAALADLRHALTVPGYWRRDFFGTVRVVDQGRLRGMFHGNTLHGLEILGRPDLPLTYYGVDSGLAKAIALQRSRKPRLRIGVVGLGIGSTAAYGRPGDQMRFYEISPLVLRLAGKGGSLFDLVDRCPAQVDLVRGDARLSLEAERRQGSQGFDVLLVDAFTGGQVPWHLLTREALELYLEQLDRNGILVLHLSSALPLDRLAAASARAMNLWALGIYHPSAEDPGTLGPLEARTTYVLLARDPGALAVNELFKAATWANVPRGFQVGPKGTLKAQAGRALAAGIRPWDDDRNSLIPLLWSALAHRRP